MSVRSYINSYPKLLMPTLSIKLPLVKLLKLLNYFDSDLINLIKLLNRS